MPVVASITGKISRTGHLHSYTYGPFVGRETFEQTETSKDRKTNMRTVITYGTFDLFHVGHLRILERARALGDRLCVGISSDEFNTLKGKKSVIPYEHRAAIVGALSCVDEVFPEHSWDQKVHDIRRVNADIFVMGHDWEGKFDHLSDLCEVSYLPRTHGISTTDIKKILGPLRSDKIAELQKALNAVLSVVEQLGE